MKITKLIGLHDCQLLFLALDRFLQERKQITSKKNLLNNLAQEHFQPSSFLDIWSLHSSLQLLHLFSSQEIELLPSSWSWWSLNCKDKWTCLERSSSGKTSSSLLLSLTFFSSLSTKLLVDKWNIKQEEPFSQVAWILFHASFAILESLLRERCLKTYTTNNGKKV